MPDLFVLGSTRDSFSIRMFGYINALTPEPLEYLSCDYQPKQTPQAGADAGPVCRCSRRSC